MELINDIQVEVNQIVIKRNSLLNKREIFKFKRRVFLSDIVSVSEENYLVNNNYSRCSGLYLKDEGWIKISEPYEEVSELHSKWYDSIVSKEVED